MHRRARRRRLGNGAGADLRARRPRRHAVGARRGQRRAVWRASAKAASCPACGLTTSIKVTRALGEASRADAILLVVPAQAMRSVIKSLAQTTGDGTPLIACAKGIEHGTHKFMTEVIAECAPQRAAGDPVRAELRRRRGARPADGGDRRGRRRGGRARSCACDEYRHVPAVSFDRRARRRARRRHQERAGDRRRHRDRQGARRQRARRR